MTQVSVIIPTFNRRAKVSRAISSVLYQTFKDFEIIVVDDASTDDTAHTLTQFGSYIRVITHLKNQGVSAARNTGIRCASSPLIAFLDSDDYWLPGKLSVQVAFLTDHSEAVACQTQERWLRKGLPANPKRRHLKPSGDIFERSLKLCLVSPSSVMVRRSLLEEVGLFDEGLPVCEDYDLWLRISCRFPIHLLDKPLVVKEGGTPDQLSKSLPGMDHYRIRALVKLLLSGRLNPLQRDLAFKEMAAKCDIYQRGCLKRGKPDEGEYYLQLPERIRNGFKSSP